MAGKENYFKLLRGEMPHHFPRFREKFMIFTPGERNMGGEHIGGHLVGDDWFGCSWTEVSKSPIGGSTITPGTCRLDDLSRFKEVIPTRAQVEAFDWQGYADEVLEGFDRENQVLECRSLNGPFERMHHLIGFENALCAFYDEPEVITEFFAAMLAYKKAVTDCVLKYMNPDIFCFDDDYGTGKSTFLSLEMWREFFPDYWKSLVDYVHSLGKYCELHTCGYITPLVGDFVAAGFDILQPIQSNNDLQYIKDNYGDKIVLRQAIFDKEFAVMNMTEEEVRADIRRMLTILAPGGRFYPEIVPIADRYYEILIEETAKFEKEFFKQA